MGRKPRVEYRGAVYHVIQRGNNREYIFRKKQDKFFLLEHLKHYREVMDFDILGYVIMDNHYHLMLKTVDAPLKDIMHRINTRFSKQFNRRNKRSGHVFESRYKSLLVMDDSYLLSLLRYIHQNPVQAKICQRIQDYPWSSDRFYRRNEGDNLVDIELILERFSVNRGHAVAAYVRFMDEAEAESEAVFEKGDVVGQPPPKLDQHRKPKSEQRKSLEAILKAVAGTSENCRAILSGSRKRHLTALKQQFITEALHANYRMKEIGECLGISGQPTISVVGLGDTAVKEARERVESALTDGDYIFPQMKVVINLTPGNVKKSGSHFDLPMASPLSVTAP
ncbi:REP-associated tyrosine transposase [Tindallia californiensis]|uniref:Transposase IS200 like n=1 Tax=Tindallia californiensis TaxID=159292 RepID=A0A1H3PD34_9FIRM|nr:magnesium chelatase domain-containing protein [Tindallia californiensis]SDY98289.1 Transposase IS200 like [Tindallia californiensis]